MKTALEILNQVEPNGELLDTEQAIKAMELYAAIKNNEQLKLLSIGALVSVIVHSCLNSLVLKWQSFTKKLCIYFCAILTCVGCGYRKDVTLRFEGGNKYHIDKWVWHGRDVICMQWYDVQTNNIDSTYKSVIIECDSIIEQHKRIIK